MRGVGDDQPEDDVDPEGEPGEEDQQQQGEADARDFESEEFGQPAADAGDDALVARTVQLVSVVCSHGLSGFRLEGVECAGGLLGNDDPEDDVGPDGDASAEDQQQRQQADRRGVGVEECGQSAADAGDRAVGPRPAEFSRSRFRGFISGFRGFGRGVRAEFSEIGRGAQLGHRGADHVDGDHAHGGGDAFAEDLPDAGLDVGHCLGILSGQSPADVVEVLFQQLTGILVEREGHRADVYVYSLFHDRTGFRRLFLRVQLF